jgi:hypothetical protein
VPGRILCPQCETPFAYSPALLGKTVKCRQCQHMFVVDGPPADAPPPAGKAVVPPPLPARVVTDREAQRRTKQREADDRHRDDPPRSRRRDEPDEELPRTRRRVPAAAPKTSGTGVLIGLIAVCLLGVLGIGAGIAWAVWPRSSRDTAPTQSAAIPTAPPVVDEPKKTLDDLINNAPKRPDPRPQIKFDPAPPEAKIDPPVAPGPPPPPVRVEPRKRPPVGGPAMPGGIDLRPPEFAPRVAPEFVPVTALPISPPTMTKSIEEFGLPGPAPFGVVAGGGKLILLHLPAQSKIGIFDVTTKALRYVDLTDPKPMIAGGMNHFLVYQPQKNTVERYNTRTLEKEATVTATFPGEVKALAMGSSSNGPLVAALGGARGAPHRGATIGLFDPVTLKELAIDMDGDRNDFGLGIHDQPPAIRVSADGGVVTGWGTQHNPGTECWTIDGGRATRHWQHGIANGAPLFPSADGRTLYGAGGPYTPTGQPIGGGGREHFAPWDRPGFVPAAHGDFVLVLAPQRRLGDDRPPKGEIFLGQEKKALHWLGDMPEAGTPRFGEARDEFDRQFFLIPDAKLLVAIDARNRSQLVLHKVDLDEALAKTDSEYLYVATQPPTVAVPGETYRYQPVVKAKKAGWKATVVSGPQGMTVGGDGTVTWAVPKTFAESQVTVILKFASGTKEVFQTVRLAVRKPK